MNRMRWTRALLATLAIIEPIAASAANMTFQQTAQAVHAYGCDASQRPAGATTRVVLTCDQAKLIDEMPALQRLGLMNPDITQTQLNMNPSMYAIGFMIQAVATLIHPLYQSTSAQETSWDAGLNIADEYGNMRRRPVLSFRFNRALDHKINWDNFSPANLAKVAPHFAFAPWVMRSMNGDE